MTESMRIAVGPTRYLPHDIALELDDRHPLAHGGFQLDVTVDDGVIISAEPRVGFMHRSAEKLFESRDYRQIMMLANRHDWYSSIHGELVIALAVEEATGITPPERASVTRTLLAEVNRVNVGLIFAGTALPRDSSVGQQALLARERLLQWMQRVSGSRIHPMIHRIGGLAHPVTSEALDALVELHTELAEIRPRLADALAEYTAELRDVAVITPEQVGAFGLSGPIAKAAGVSIDLRRDDPYAAYREFAELISDSKVQGAGVQGRYAALIDEMATALTIIDAAVERLRFLGAGPIDVPLPKVVRVPESMTYSWVEGPIGRTGALVVGSGDKMPWRLALSTPSMHSMQALSSVLPGVELTQLSAVLSSIFMVIGDVDR